MRDDRLGEVDAHPSAPIILLTRERKAKQRDPRVAGTLRRPARLHELYRLDQVAFSRSTRRAVPRDADVAARTPAAKTPTTSST